MVTKIFHYKVKSKVRYEGEIGETVCCKLKIKSLATGYEIESPTFEKSCSPGSSVTFEFSQPIEHDLNKEVRVSVNAWLKNKPSVKDSETRTIKPPCYITDYGIPTLVNISENIYAFIKIKNVSDRRAKFRVARELVDPLGVKHKSMDGFEVEEYLDPGEEKRYGIWGITCRTCYRTHSTYEDACPYTGSWINRIRVYKDGRLIVTLEEDTWVGG